MLSLSIGPVLLDKYYLPFKKSMIKNLLQLLLLVICLSGQARPLPPELAGKTISVIVPYGPGGNSDITARQLARGVEQITGLSVIVINRPGASGIVGTQQLLQAEPNGLTLGQFETGPAMVNAIQGLPNAPSREQLIPVSASIESSLALIVSSDVASTSVQDFMRWLQQKDRANYATVGGIQTLMTEALLDTVKVRSVRGVTYKSQAETLRSVVSGETAFVLASVGDAQGLIDAGRLKVLAVGSRARSPLLPTVPALTEIYPGFVTVNYNGVFAPRGTPLHIVNYLNWAWAQAVADPGVHTSLVARHNVPLGGSVEQAWHYYNSYYDSRRSLFQQYRHLLPN